MSQPKKIIRDDEDEVQDEDVYPEYTTQSQETLVSDEINEIISNKPHWMVRYGVSLIGIASLLLLLISWLVRYPDVVKTSLNIVKSSDNTFYGEINAKKLTFSKVAIGQDVRIRIGNSYLRGKVVSIAHPAGNNSKSIIRIALPDGMRTNNDRPIPFKTGLKANAEIIIQNKRLLEKLFLNTR